MCFCHYPHNHNIVNLSLSSGHFHPLFEQSVVSPLLKKSTLDNEQLSNYRPISRLSLISKIIERVVKSRLNDHLFSHCLLNAHQSAYRRHHSTETSLLYTHDHLITAIGSQKLSRLCLLDLSAAFDTIDHDILLTRLSSWLGIHGSVLNWLKSYLSSRTFCVKCNDCFSSLHTSLYGFPHVTNCSNFSQCDTALLRMNRCIYEYEFIALKVDVLFQVR